MSAVKKLFSHYIISNMAIILVFLFVNLLLIIGIPIILGNVSSNSLDSMDTIANNIAIDDHWQVSIEEQTTELLDRLDAWVMVLDDNGTVIWEYARPKSFANHYSPADIAKFSRWYLDDFPIVMQTLNKGLLVVGYPPNTLVKLNYVLNTTSLNMIIYMGAAILAVNAILVLLLIFYNTRKMERKVSPILKGIIAMSKGQPVSLTNTNELAQISAELNRASHYIIKKETARADWINGISHDVRTPLSIILGYAAELEDNQLLPLTEQTKAKIIRQHGEKLRQLITDLNLSSKLDDSKQPITLVSLYPVELARQVISEVLNNGLSEDYSIDFHSSTNMDTLSFLGDSSLIERVLRNLLYNCVRHNPNGCQIHVSVNITSTHFNYVILDDGCGFSDKQLDQFNANHFSNTKYLSNGETAHGFGLRLVWQIVEAHTGQLLFDNLEKGGAMVKISFPLNSQS